MQRRASLLCSLPSCPACPAGALRLRTAYRPPASELGHPSRGASDGSVSAAAAKACVYGWGLNERRDSAKRTRQGADRACGNDGTSTCTVLDVKTRTDCTLVEPRRACYSESRQPQGVCHIARNSITGGAAHVGAAHEIERGRQPPLVLQYIVDDALAGGGGQQREVVEVVASPARLGGTAALLSRAVAHDVQAWLVEREDARAALRRDETTRLRSHAQLHLVVR
eukprot:scaffold67859_cov65-Phaeocystis_antarctica.AAC.2